MSNKIFAFVVMSIITLLLWSCDPPPCEVEYYELEPIQKKLYLEIPDSTFYSHELFLTEVKMEPTSRTETVLINDSLQEITVYDTLYSCSIRISGTLRNIEKGDTVNFGNTQAGGTFSKLIMSLDKVNINTKSIDVSLWKVRFVQDCSNWSE